MNEKKRFILLNPDGWLTGTVRMLTPLRRSIWVDLLAMAGSGRFPGWVAMGYESGKLQGYPLKKLAEHLDYNRQALRQALELFVKQERIEITDTRAIRIVNWAKYQFMKAYEPGDTYRSGGDEVDESVVIDDRQITTSSSTTSSTFESQTTEKQELKSPISSSKTKNKEKEMEGEPASLSKLLFEKLHKPTSYRNCYSSWEEELRSLLSSNPDLPDLLEFALVKDEFWSRAGGWLKVNGGPVAFLRNNLAKIRTAYDSYLWNNKPKAKKALHPPGATPPSTAKKTRYDITKMGIEEASKWVSEHLSDFTEKDFEDFKFRRIYG